MGSLIEGGSTSNTAPNINQTYQTMSSGRSSTTESSSTRGLSLSKNNGNNLSLNNSNYFQHLASSAVNSTNTAVENKLKQQIPQHAHYLIPSIMEAGQQENIDPHFLAEVIRQESGFRPSVLRAQQLSSAGAIGPMQLMLPTAQGLGLNEETVTDPHLNIMNGAKYLRQQYNRFGSWERALAAYNGGPGRLSRNNGNIAAMPSETRNYVPAIMSKYQQWS
jgi:soluble lytic murein transglycosylase-like protein